MAGSDGYLRPVLVGCWNSYMEVLMSDKTGGPAFPQHGVCTPEMHSWDSDDFGGRGVTIRDYFAAKAMQSICLSTGGHFHSNTAEQAYLWADAMLKARSE